MIGSIEGKLIEVTMDTFEGDNGNAVNYCRLLLSDSDAYQDALKVFSCTLVMDIAKKVFATKEAIATWEGKDVVLQGFWKREFVKNDMGEANVFKISYKATGIEQK